MATKPKTYYILKWVGIETSVETRETEEEIIEIIKTLTPEQQEDAWVEKDDLILGRWRKDTAYGYRGRKDVKTYFEF